MSHIINPSNDYYIYHIIPLWYCGWLRNPVPVETGGLSHYLWGFNMFQPSKVMQDFLHSMNQPWLLTNFFGDDISWYLVNSIFCWIYQPCLLWILWINDYYILLSPNTAIPGKVTAGKQLGPEFFGYRSLFARQR